MVKKIILILAFVLSAVTAMAQVNTSFTGGELSREGNKLFLDGKQLSTTEMPSVLGSDLYNLYRRGKTQKLVGSICIPVGCLIGGLGTWIIVDCNKSEDTAALEVANSLFAKPFGYAFLIFGGGAAITGIVFHCLGSNKQTNVVVGYNNTHKYAMTLSPASSGLGLALNF